MSYDPIFIQPMRDDLTRLGVAELRTAEEVDNAIKQDGMTLVIVNSVCGCAAGGARPGLALAMREAQTLPDNIVSVFAGQDIEATARAREYFTNQPPSSPAMALLQNGQLVAMIHRHHIEGRTAEKIGEGLAYLFEEFCGEKAAATAE